jgi:PilZ domain
MAVFKRENRKARHTTKHDAWVTLDGGFAKRNCTILDLSSGGARIQLSDPGVTESNVNLAFSKDVRKATRCRVVWRKGSIVGVEFLART